MKVTAVRGFSDIFPGEVETWQFLEQMARDIFSSYNFAEIRIPILEKTELFSRSIGETTDIVEKEMYTFVDRDVKESVLPPGAKPDGMRGSSLTLRPEGTAGVVRAYVESEMYKIEPVRRLYYMGPMFRRERPQKGRTRQFHQIGAEALGRGDPFIDAEILLLLDDLFAAVGLKEPSLQLNSLGCVKCRPGYREELLRFLMARELELCANCRRRMERNALRVLDCKEAKCATATQDAPAILDSLCEDCREHFESVQHLLEQNAVNYTLNPRMVRGLDYYCRTTFEWTSNQLGSQNAVAAGGRYDGLVQDLGGPAIPGVGFAMGVERLVLLLGNKGGESNQPLVHIAWMGQRARDWAFPVVHRLRRSGITVEMEGEERSLKSHLRRADKLRTMRRAVSQAAFFVVIVGDAEMEGKKVILRDMDSKKQSEITLDEVVSEITRRARSA